MIFVAGTSSVVETSLNIFLTAPGITFAESIL